jgi:hypothetical protein
MTDRTTFKVPALLLCYLRRLGVAISLNDRGDGLRLSPAGKLCPNARGHLHDAKAELVKLLKSQAEVAEDDEIREHLDRIIPGTK